MLQCDLHSNTKWTYANALFVKLIREKAGWKSYFKWGLERMSIYGPERKNAVIRPIGQI